ncbi:hypothetical protein TRIUR3_27067 [Triticum urartu]|uniref:Uncharacterized protein n=1 Tax=Triticum urartu TaxID=4572 RepID=M7ZXH0_TRIUA|nr:hypothetical protein TRIUR3_27067 [Triticum urartu]
MAASGTGAARPRPGRRSRGSSRGSRGSSTAGERGSSIASSAACVIEEPDPDCGSSSKATTLTGASSSSLSSPAQVPRTCGNPSRRSPLADFGRQGHTGLPQWRDLLLPLPSVHHLPLPSPTTYYCRCSPRGPVVAVSDCICYCCRRLDLLLLSATSSATAVGCSFSYSVNCIIITLMVLYLKISEVDLHQEYSKIVLQQHTTMDLNLMPEEEVDEAQEEEQAQQGDAMDWNLMPDEEVDEAQQEEQAQQGDGMDLNLMPDEEVDEAQQEEQARQGDEEQAQQGDSMDLKLMPDEEVDEAQQKEQAQQGDTVDLNLMPEEEVDEAEQEEQAQQGDAMDLNLILEEDDEDIELNWFPEEAQEDAEVEEAQEDAEVEEAQEDAEVEEAQEYAEVEEAQEADAQGNPRGKDLTDNERFGVYFTLRVIELRDGQVHLYDRVLIATMLNVHVRTITRIWNLANEQLAAGQEVDVSSKKKKNSGRKRKELDRSRTTTIPLNKRRTILSLARCLGVPRSTLHDKFQLQELKRITSTIKPTLNPQNKIARLKFCLSMMDERWISSPWPSFKPMTNMVHIDEKWYDMTRVKSSYYVLPGEEQPN